MPVNKSFFSSASIVCLIPVKDNTFEVDERNTIQDIFIDLLSFFTWKNSQERKQLFKDKRDGITGASYPLYSL